MEKSKHTPGPWKLSTVTTSCGICHKVGPFPSKQLNQETHACIYVDYPSGHHPAEAELMANARLIAAAPELLDALKTTATNLRSHIAATHSNTFECWLEVVEAAITKAEGK